MKRFFAVIAAFLIAASLVGCSNTNTEPSSDSSHEESTGSEESYSSSDESKAVSAETDSESDLSVSSEPEKTSDYEETGEHTIDLCNGLEQDVVSLKIRSGSGEEDYWSYELLGDTPWEKGTAISLLLQKEEWGEVADGWELEATLADGTVENFTALPLTEWKRIELTADGFRTDSEN